MSEETEHSGSQKEQTHGDSPSIPRAVPVSVTTQNDNTSMKDLDTSNSTPKTKVPAATTQSENKGGSGTVNQPPRQPASVLRPSAPNKPAATTAPTGTAIIKPPNNAIGNPTDDYTRATTNRPATVLTRRVISKLEPKTPITPSVLATKSAPMTLDSQRHSPSIQIMESSSSRSYLSVLWWAITSPFVFIFTLIIFPFKAMSAVTLWVLEPLVRYYRLSRLLDSDPRYCSLLHRRRGLASCFCCRWGRTWCRCTRDISLALFGLSPMNPTTSSSTTRSLPPFTTSPNDTNHDIDLYDLSADDLLSVLETSNPAASSPSFTTTPHPHIRHSNLTRPILAPFVQMSSRSVFFFAVASTIVVLGFLVALRADRNVIVIAVTLCTLLTAVVALIKILLLSATNQMEELTRVVDPTTLTFPDHTYKKSRFVMTPDFELLRGIQHHCHARPSPDNSLLSMTSNKRDTSTIPTLSSSSFPPATPSTGHQDGSSFSLVHPRLGRLRLSPSTARYEIVDDSLSYLHNNKYYNSLAQRAKLLQQLNHKQQQLQQKERLQPNPPSSDKPSSVTTPQPPLPPLPLPPLSLRPGLSWSLYNATFDQLEERLLPLQGVPKTLYFLCAAHDDAASRSHSPTPSASVPSFTSSTHEPMITLTGQRAAKVLAAALRSPVHNKMRVDCIVSSPSSRALDTLHLAMPWLSKLPVIALEGLRSRRSSPINDIRRSVPDLEAAYPSVNFGLLETLHDPLPDNESLTSFRARVQSALSLLFTLESSHLVVATHADVINEILHILNHPLPPSPHAQNPNGDTSCTSENPTTATTTTPTSTTSIPTPSLTEKRVTPIRRIMPGEVVGVFAVRFTD